MSAQDSSVPELHIQKLLRNGKNLKKVCHQNDIRIVPHRTKPHIITLKYMDKANPFNKFSNQARGTIISIKPEDNFKVIALPYFRFYNLGEKFTDVIDWSTTRVLEKLDGSLIILYYYDGEWCFATSGTPDAYGMSDLINKVWKQLNYRFPDPEDQDKTFMFELCSLKNKIVVSYEVERMVLHGVRSIVTFQEEMPDAYAIKYGYELIKSYPVYTLEDAHTMVLKFNPTQNEGCVYVDHAFRRVKDKNPDYVVLSKTAEGDSIEVTILKTIFANDGSEFLSTNPDKTELYNEIYQKYAKLCEEIDRVWHSVNGLPDRKSFFQTVNSLATTDVSRWYKNCLLEMYTNKTKNKPVDIREWVNKQNATRVINYL